MLPVPMTVGATQRGPTVIAAGFPPSVLASEATVKFFSDSRSVPLSDSSDADSDSEVEEADEALKPLPSSLSFCPLGSLSFATFEATPACFLWRCEDPDSLP